MLVRGLSVRQESDDAYGTNYLRTEAIIARLLRHYNEEQVHATLGYMAPVMRVEGFVRAKQESTRCLRRRLLPCCDPAMRH